MQPACAPAARSYGVLVLVASAAACAPAAPRITRPTAPVVAAAAGSIEVHTTPTTDEAAAPTDVRCGVDDEPAPIGELLSPPRRARAAEQRALVGFAIDPQELAARRGNTPPFDVRAARHHGTTTWTLAPSVNPPTPFFERVAACGAEVDATDVGRRSFAIRFAASGDALWVRRTDAGEASPTVFSSCLARAACSLHDGHGEQARTRAASFVTEVEAPSFLGKAIAHLLPAFDPRTGREVPVRSVLPQAETIRVIAEDIAAKCAAARPPAQSFSFDLSLAFDGESEPRDLRFSPSLQPYPAYVATCVREGIVAGLPKGSRRRGTKATLHLRLQLLYLSDVPGQL